jgi:hypothetical protein
MKAERKIRRWTGVSTVFSKVRGVRLVKFAPTVLLATQNTIPIDVEIPLHCCLGRIAVNSRSKTSLWFRGGSKPNPPPLIIKVRRPSWTA